MEKLVEEVIDSCQRGQTPSLEDLLRQYSRMQSAFSDHFNVIKEFMEKSHEANQNRVLDNSVLQATRNSTKTAPILRGQPLPITTTS